MWSGRDLSLEGKVHVIKSLGISTILYALGMKGVSQRFLWKGKRNMIKRNICTLPRSLGEIGMVDLNILVKVNRIMFLL